MSDYRIIVADVLAGLAQLPDESVHCCVTSPPYWGLRDYGVPGQLGLEPTPDEYVARMVAVFREVRRVLRADGTCWLNLGDSYAGSGKGGNPEGSAWSGFVGSGGREKAAKASKPYLGLAQKQLVGIPWRVAFALQADGWWLRQDIIWAKPNPMPESVTDRCTKAHEYIFLLSKSARYWYDAEAVKEESSGVGGGASFGKQNHDASGTGAQSRTYERPDYAQRNARSVWTIATAPYPEAHFATFPPALPERCIKAGTSERGCCPRCGAPWVRKFTKTLIPTKKAAKTFVVDERDHSADANDQGSNRQKDGHRSGYINSVETTGWDPGCGCNAGDPVPCLVLDPFCGSGTTLAVACQLSRAGVGIELNPEYAALAHRRIWQATRPNTYRDESKACDAPLFGAAT